MGGELTRQLHVRVLDIFIAIFVLTLCGCTTVQRGMHMYSREAPQPVVFTYKDGGSSVYYAFNVNSELPLDTVLFFYGGTGCPSWKSVMPEYVDGLTIHAHILVLNKRFVSDRSTGMFDCGQDFKLANNPQQWVSDYSEFITAQLGLMPLKPKNVVLVAVSEGVYPAARVASINPNVTHLAIIGGGGYSMRQSLDTLKQKGLISFDVNAGWAKITSDPRSTGKSWYGNPYRWWSDIMDIDPLEDFLKLNIPILVGIGEQDHSTPVESARFLKSIFVEAGKSNLTLKVYPGADHRLNGNGASYRQVFFRTLSCQLHSDSAC